MNNPDYCQGIYDAARKLVEYYETRNALTVEFDVLGKRIRNLKKALEGKK